MLLRRIYTIYALAISGLIYLLFFPLFFLALQKKSWHKYAHRLNKIWGWGIFICSGLRYQVIHEFRQDPEQPYIFCANHTSYIDIPAIYLSIKGEPVFVAKQELSKVPLFGYMYSRLHINIDRNNAKSRAETLIKGKELLKEGKNIIFFPEGTIPKHEKNPEMIAFNDGPFRLAIDQQIPVVPVTIPYNWLILPDNGKWLAQPHKIRIIFHEPIQTSGMERKDIELLKQKTFQTIENRLMQEGVLNKTQKQTDQPT